MIEPQLLVGLDYNFHQIALAISHLVSTGVFCDFPRYYP